MELTLGVTLAVLGAGLLHAGWNALIKSAGGGDALLDTATIVAGSTICSLAVAAVRAAAVRGLVADALASVVIHFGYYLTLAQAYRTGDLSFAYPLMRGTAPLLVTLLGVVFLRELPAPHVAIGIVLICAGIVAIAFAQRHQPSARRGVLGADQRGDHRGVHAGRRVGRAAVGQRAVLRRVAHVLRRRLLPRVDPLAARRASVTYIGDAVAARPARRLLQRRARTPSCSGR